MKRVFLFLAILLMPFSAFAKEIQVKRVTSSEAREVGFMSPKAAFNAIAGRTYTFSRMRGNGNRRGKDAFPFAGTVVGYFAPNGQILIWAKGEEKVRGGRWTTGRSVDHKDGTLLCFDFANNNEMNLCAIIKVFGKKIYYSAKGNIFKLRKGAKVPRVVKKHQRDLKKTIKLLGL